MTQLFRLQGQISKAKTEDSLTFAVTQAADHAGFLYFGLELPALKEEALRRALELHGYMKARGMDPAPTATEIKAVGHTIVAATIDPVKAIRELIAFRERVLEMQVGKKQWTGWLFPTFMAHTADEDRFNLEEVEGVAKSDTEIVDHHRRIIGEHHDFVAHLLNPASPFRPLNPVSVRIQRKLIDDSLKNAKEMYDLDVDVDDAVQFQVLIEKVLKNVRAHQRTGVAAITVRPASVLPDSLVLHVAREGARAEAALKALSSRAEKKGTFTRPSLYDRYRVWFWVAGLLVLAFVISRRRP